MLDIENPIKVVIVSADFLMVEYLQTILDTKKFFVITTNPSPEAISGTRKITPDLFIVDDPGDTATILSICQVIRQYSCMPILILSAQRRAGLVEQTLDAGADEFLIKPVPASVLIAHVNTLARRALAEKDAALSIIRSENGHRKQLDFLTH